MSFPDVTRKEASSFDMTTPPPPFLRRLWWEVGRSGPETLSCSQGGMVVEWPGGGEDDGAQFCVGLNGSCLPIGLETRLNRDLKERPQLSPQRSLLSPFLR